MKRHIAYLKYLIRHKWFVLYAGVFFVKSPLWRLIIHDWSKFLPSEWVPYARRFYNLDGSKNTGKPGMCFQTAWLHHMHRNKHHWLHWVLILENGDKLPMPMPQKYILEMVADWMGAGRAITGRWDIAEWFYKSVPGMILHEATAYACIRIINRLPFVKAKEDHPE